MSQWIDRADLVSRYKSLKNSTVFFLQIPPPEDLVGRLQDGYGLTWNVIPPLAQQALLWDSGYILAKRGNEHTWMQAQLPCTSSLHMEDIAIAPNQVIGQSLQECKSPFGIYEKSKTMDAGGLETVLKCAFFVNGFNIPMSTSSFYSQDALGSLAIPEPRLFIHGSSIASIHTLPINLYPESIAGECPASSNGMVIPCKILSYSKDPSFCVPAQSTAMRNWLLEIRANKATLLPASSTSPIVTSNPIQNSPEDTTIVPTSTTSNPFTTITNSSPSETSLPLIWGLGGGGGVVFLALLIFGLIWRRNRRRADIQLEMDIARLNEANFSQQYRKKELATSVYNLALTPFLDSTNPNLLTKTPSPMFSINPKEQLCNLYDLEPLKEYHLPLEALEWETLLDSTGTAEIYYGQIHQYHAVTIKLLRVDRAQDVEVVDSFVQEILWMCRLKHTCIVNFMGCAWDHITYSPCSLVAVTEYCPQGTLLSFLLSNPPLQWNLKATLALNIVNALAYMHDGRVIHRGLTSRSVWIDWPLAKLMPLNITAMNENPRASIASGHEAPEILRSGAPYTSASDIYAFGCLLCELDTQKELESASGKRLHPSRDCPNEIAILIEQCLNFQPAQRPTSIEVATILESFILGHEHSGFI